MPLSPLYFSGAYPIFAFPRVLIDIAPVLELKTHFIDQNLVLGAATTLTDTIDLFYKLSKTNEEFSYLAKLAEHLELVAHIPVRNVCIFFLVLLLIIIVSIISMFDAGRNYSWKSNDETQGTSVFF